MLFIRPIQYSVDSVARCRPSTVQRPAGRRGTNTMMVGDTLADGTVVIPREVDESPRLFPQLTRL